MKNWLTGCLCNNNTARAVIVSGLVLSLITGLLDIAINISSKPSGLYSFSYLLIPLAVMVVFFLLVYSLLSFSVILPFARLARLDSIASAISFGVFFATITTLSSLNDQVVYSLFPADLFKLFVLFLSSVLIAVGTYFSIKFFSIMTQQYKNSALRLVLAMPFVLAETVVLMWFHEYRAESFNYIPSVLGWVVYFILVFSTFVLIHRLTLRIGARNLFVVFVAIVVLSPVALLLKKAEYKSSSHMPNGGVDHVILVTVDTLRADALSCYDPRNVLNVLTPNIDRLATDGILFANAISPAPWTLPSLGSMMTGLSPLVHKATKINSQLPDTVSTLAERMRDAGYFTTAIVSNGFLSPYTNISQGFSDYNFFPRYSIGNSWGVELVEWLMPQKFKMDISTDEQTKLASEWLERNRDKRFFLWIHYYDPHIPYSPPPEFLPKGEPPPRIGNSFAVSWEIRNGNFTPSLAERRWIRELYYGEVRYVDHSLGKLLDSLKKMDIYDESLIVLTSDHGEEFWEHGGYEHGHSLYNEVIKVPLIIKLPRSIESKLVDQNKALWQSPNTKIDTMVSTQSIKPTVLDICGIEYVGDYLSSDSLAPLWEKRPNSLDENPIISTGLLYYEDKEAVIYEGLKYIRSLMTNREELYDLSRDPKELISIGNTNPNKLRMARNVLRKNDKIVGKLAEVNRIEGEKKVNFDDETKNKLKSLGYLQ